MDAEAINAQLRQFGYSEQEITDGVQMAVNKSDINEIVECIESYSKKQLGGAKEQVRLWLFCAVHIHSLSVRTRRVTSQASSSHMAPDGLAPSTAEAQEEAVPWRRWSA